MDQVRFYMDEHIPSAVTPGLRRRGLDVLTAQEAGLHPSEDAVHLERARGERRVIVTQDADFLRMHAGGATHAGIVDAPQHTPVGQLVRHLMLVVDVLSREEMENHVEFLHTD